MEPHAEATREEWIEARKQLLAEEKEFNRLRDRLSEKRRELPWVRVEKGYVFDGPAGPRSLAEVFEGRNQLIVYHFMFDPTWDEGCKSCSFWADNFNGIQPHLNQRDVTFIAISRAPLVKIEAFKARMGWTFTWLSSAGTDFNFDFGVSFRPDDAASGKAEYNYAPMRTKHSELVGISVFAKKEGGQVFHTYSCYSRGVDMLNGAYHYLDLVPKGRDEAGLPYTKSWLRHHDRYA